jgi:hypothetical protein
MKTGKEATSEGRNYVVIEIEETMTRVYNENDYHIVLKQNMQQKTNFFACFPPIFPCPNDLILSPHRCCLIFTR